MPGHAAGDEKERSLAAPQLAWAGARRAGDLALVVALHDLEDLLGHLHRVVVVVDGALVLHLTLQPVRVERERVELVVGPAIVGHLFVVVLEPDDRASDLVVVDPLVLVVLLVAQLVRVALLLVVVLVENDAHTEVLVHGGAFRALLLEIEVSDLCADLHQLSETLVGHGRQEILGRLLLGRTLQSVVLDHRQDLVRRAAQDIRRLLAHERREHVQELLIRLARRLCLWTVRTRLL